jgi:hypothetical protein
VLTLHFPILFVLHFKIKILEWKKFPISLPYNVLRSKWYLVTKFWRIHLSFTSGKALKYVLLIVLFKNKSPYQPFTSTVFHLNYQLFFPFGERVYRGPSLGVLALQVAFSNYAGTRHFCSLCALSHDWWHSLFLDPGGILRAALVLFGIFAGCLSQFSLEVSRSFSCL